jgi:ABC-type multidrug transport system ATPase subunit
MELAFANLHVHRGTVAAVSGATGSLPHRAWTAVIGPNGSGKTSLLRTLCGRLPAAAGSIAADGEDRTADRLWRAAAIGFAPDAAALPDGLSARQYLALVRRGAAAAPTEDRLRPLREALAFERFADAPLGALSAGLRQRVAIYSAFANATDTVILDEPFNWLDPVCAFETKQALRGLVDAAGLTLVTALHDLSTLTVYCDGGLLMSEGKLVRSLSRIELRRGARDVAAFESDLIGQLRGY